jgi:hypothetical protein
MHTSRILADILLIVAPACHPDKTPPFCVFVDAPTLFVLDVDSYLSHVELDTLAERYLLVYGHCGISSSRGNTFILMDIKTMLGYLTGFQLDTPEFVLKDLIFRPLFRTILKNKTERTTIFSLLLKKNKTLFTRRSTQHAYVLCFGSITKEDLTITRSVETHTVKYNIITRVHIKYVLSSTCGFRIILSY